MAFSLNSSLALRVVSALVLMPVVLAALILGSGYFAIMLGLALGIAMKEWTAMAKKLSHTPIRIIAGALYFIICIGAFYFIRSEEPYGAGLALALILSIWASDSGAYFAGKSIGGPKMAPSISPNKTWAGLVGGMVSSTALLIVYALYVGPWLEGLRAGLALPAITMAQLAILGVLVTLAGQAGDLIESSQKRAAGVKDSGNLIPGHGGLLDRIDALLLASPVFLIALKVFGL